MFSSRASQTRRAISGLAKTGIVISVIVIISVGGFLVLSRPSGNSSTNSTTTVTTSTTSSLFSFAKNYSISSTSSNHGIICPCPNIPQTFVDEAVGTGAYDSLDPSYGFFTIDGFFMSVFQGLLTNPYNGTAIVPTYAIPALASNYSVTGNSPICMAPTAEHGGSSNCVPSPFNYTQYNFNMRGGTEFSDADHVNAYSAWFSFVRVLWYHASSTVGISNYAGLTVNTTIDEPCYNGTILARGCGENIWPDGLMNALIRAGDIGNVNPTTQEGQNELVGALNQMLSNYDPEANTTQAAIVGYPDQAYVANSASSFTINLIEPYRLFPLALTGQWAAIQDPKYIDQNGGLQNNTGLSCSSTQCMNFNTNGMPGTGPYMYDCPSQCPAQHSELGLVRNLNYWAVGIPGLNAVLEPASISLIIMKFGLQPNSIISDFASNDAQVASIPFEQLNQSWSSFHSNYPHYNFTQIFSDQGVPLCDFAFEMNTQVSPNRGETYTGNNTDAATIRASTLVRQAIVHAVNYTTMMTQLFSYNGTDLGELFLPPVPPGYGSLDNPGNLPLYSYNITLAAIDLNQAGKILSFYTILPHPITIDGTIYNELGDNTTGNLFSAIPLGYLPPLTPSLQTQFNIMNSGLQQVGLTLSTIGYIGCGAFSCGLSPATTAQVTNDGWCADWGDPIYQQFYDMGTSIASQANWPDNATLNNLLFKIPFETNSTLQLQQTELAYQIFTQMATIIQVPTGIDNSESAAGGAFMIQPYVHNLVFSFSQSGFAYNMVEYS